jgi:PTH1 family peptidyl-tRNA hydrolase
MLAVVGLGNPGDEYARTRHNVGFRVVEELARRWGAAFGKARRGARVARARFSGKPVILVQPQTLMNCSAEAVARLDADIRPKPEEMVVVHDDIDLACGRVAVKRGGGTGGHRGLASLVAWGGPDFARTRVGVGRPPIGQEASAYVLRPFRAEERPKIEEAIRRAADAVEAILAIGVERAMNSFNVRPVRTAQAAGTPEENS